MEEAKVWMETGKEERNGDFLAAKPGKGVDAGGALIKNGVEKGKMY